MKDVKVVIGFVGIVYIMFAAIVLAHVM